MSDEKDKWHRPSGVDFPQIWVQFYGKSGRRYWVQDMTDDHRENVMHFMTNNFILDEPLDKYSKYPADDTYKAEMKEYLSVTLDQQLGLVCLTEVVAADGQVQTVVAGMNFTCRSYKGELKEDDTLSTPRFRAINMVLDFMMSQRDAFDTFGISEYLGARGLYVLPKYRGEGVGLHLLEAREYLCLAVGFEATFTVFTSIASQTLAEKCGFQDVYSLTYDELARMGKEFEFPGINENTGRIRYMYKFYK